MNRDSLKIHATNSKANSAADNDSNTVSTPSVTAVGTINSGKGIRRWFSSLLLLGIVFSFGLGVFSPKSAYALPDPRNWSPSLAAWAECAEWDDIRSCGECHGMKPKGTGRITCDDDDMALDLGTLSDFIVNTARPERFEKNRTAVFFPKDHKNPGKEGKGYIDAEVIYGHVIPETDEVKNAYLLCDAMEFDGYDAWIKACVRYYGYKEPAPVVVKPELHKATIESTTSVLTVTSNGDHAIVEFDNKEGAAMQFDVVDMNGLTVNTITTQGNSFTVSGLASGIYFVNCKENPNLQAKIVIAQ